MGNAGSVGDDGVLRSVEEVGDMSPVGYECVSCATDFVGVVFLDVCQRKENQHQYIHIEILLYVALMLLVLKRTGRGEESTFANLF